jgi:hypothetical protein
VGMVLSLEQNGRTMARQTALEGEPHFAGREPHVDLAKEKLWENKWQVNLKLLGDTC